MAVATPVDSDTPHPGRRALEFCSWAVERFGVSSVADPDNIIISASQAELALAHPQVDSPGTVAYYIRKLRQAGVVTQTRPIHIDAHRLSTLTEEPATNTRRAPVGEPTASRPSAPEASTRTGGGGGDGGGRASGGSVDAYSLLVEQNRLISQTIEVLAAAVQAQSKLIDQLTSVDAPVLRGSRESANDGFADSAIVRGIRESQEGRQEVSLTLLENPDLPELPDLPTRSVREDEARESANSGHGVPRTFAEREFPADIRGEARLPHQVVDEAVAPLRDWCQRNGRPFRLDDRGREVLAGLSVEALKAGVENLCREASQDSSITRPIGLLIRRAQTGDLDTFKPHLVSGPDPGFGGVGRARQLALTLAEQGDDRDEIRHYLLNKGFPESTVSTALEPSGTQ